jgi:hypothetical protein
VKLNSDGCEIELDGMGNLTGKDAKLNWEGCEIELGRTEVELRRM